MRSDRFNGPLDPIVATMRINQAACQAIRRCRLTVCFAKPNQETVSAVVVGAS